MTIFSEMILVVSGVNTAIGVLLGTTMGHGNLQQARDEKNKLIMVGILFTPKYTQLGPVAMYMICRCVDFVRIIFAGILLKRALA